MIEMIKANPDMGMTLEIWNMMENKNISQALEITLPLVKHNKIIYVPMTDTIFTRENVLELPTLESQGVPN